MHYMRFWRSFSALAVLGFGLASSAARATCVEYLTLGVAVVPGVEEQGSGKVREAFLKGYQKDIPLKTRLEVIAKSHLRGDFLANTGDIHFFTRQILPEIPGSTVKELRFYMWFLNTLRPAEGSIPEDFRRAWEAEALKDLGDFEMDDLLYSMRLMNHFKWDVGADFTAAFLEAMTERIEEIPTGELVHLLKDLSFAGIRPPAEFFARIQEQASTHITEFSPADLTQIPRMLALSKMGMKYSLFRAWQAAMIHKMHKLDAIQLQRSLHYLEEMRLLPSPEFFLRWQTAFAAKAQDADADTLASAVSLIGAYGVNVDPIFTLNWKSAMGARIAEKSVTNRQMAAAAFGFHLLRDLHTVRWLAERLSGGNLDEFTSRILGQVYRYFAIVHDFEIAPFKAYGDLLPFLNYEPAHDISPLEAKMASELNRRGVQFVREHKITDGIYVDFYVPGEKVAFQVDGAQHFYRDVEGRIFLRAKDERIQEVIEHLGHKVVRVNFTTLNPIAGE